MNKDIRIIETDRRSFIINTIKTNVYMALVSKSMWAVHVFMAAYMKSYQPGNFFMREEIGAMDIGYFFNSRTFRLFQVNILGMHQEVGKVLITADRKHCDICFIAINSITASQLADVQILLTMIAQQMTPFFRSASFDSCPEMNSIDFRFSDLNFSVVSAAQRSGSFAHVQG